MFENVGIAFVNVDFSSFETMKASVRLTAEVLGGDAPEIAEKYIAYLDESIEWTQERTANISDEKRISIVHGHPAHDLLIDGGDSVIDEWIVYSGCINAAAEDIKGLVQAASIEMMYEWDPDVIISGDYADDREAVLDDPAWANLKAVKNGNVITDPKGLMMWDRSGIELPLQVKWCVATMYPELFEDFSIREEIKLFFREFFDYEFSDEDIEKMLNHLDP